MANTSDFIRKINERITSQGIKKKDLAEKMGLTPQNLNRILKSDYIDLERALLLIEHTGSYDILSEVLGTEKKEKVRSPSGQEELKTPLGDWLTRGVHQLQDKVKFIEEDVEINKGDIESHQHLIDGLLEKHHELKNRLDQMEKKSVN